MTVGNRILTFERLGLLASPDLADFPGTYMQTPTPITLGDRIRVFVSTRLQGKAYGAYVDLEPGPPFSVIGYSKQPVTSLGKLGTFDDEGVMPAFCMFDPSDSRKLMMFVSGWNTRNTIRYHNSTGLQVSYNDGLDWERPFDGPVLDRTPIEPYLAVTPWVITRANQSYQAWYISGLDWSIVDGVTEPRYVIKSAVSEDLVNWRRDGRQVVASHSDGECFSRPVVSVLPKGQYQMLFCSRDMSDYRTGRGAYRIGGAVSEDGTHFERCHSVKLLGETGDWEKVMQAYPAWITIDGERYTFYNGDGFGRTGFGILKYVE